MYSGHTKMVLGVGGLANQMALLRSPLANHRAVWIAEERHLIGKNFRS